MKIRFATIKDAPELLKIYEQYIDTPITFEEKIPSLYEYEQRIDNIIRRYPYLVCKSNNVIIGYAYDIDKWSVTLINGMQNYLFIYYRIILQEGSAKYFIQY